MDSSVIWFVAFILFILVAHSTYTNFIEKKRTEELELIAKKLGFSFSKSGRESTESTHKNFELFSLGHSKELKNEMWGKDLDFTFSIFGYSYRTGHGQNTMLYNQTVLSLQCKDLNLPKFDLKPEDTIYKIAQIFGYQDIDFEAFPFFSKKYLLRGDDENKVRELFSPDVIKYFEQNQNICVESQGSNLIFYKKSKRSEPEEIHTFYKDGRTALLNFLE
jgi:hypothetical protein